MGTAVHELRLSIRRLVHDPMRTSIAVAALMLGIGLTASMFSVAYTILFRGMPFEGPDELVAVERRNADTGARVRWIPFLSYLDVAEHQRSLSHIGAWVPTLLDLADEETRPERVRSTMLSPSFLRLLRASPQIGRGLASDEFGPSARVVLMSDRLWRNRYGADRGVVGRVLRLDGERFTVIGVMEPGFHYPMDQDLFIPLPYDPATLQVGEAFVQVVGRLPAGADAEAARVELETIFARVHREVGEPGPPPGAALIPLVQSHLGEDEVALLWAMMIGSVLVLAIACVNVTNLLTAVAADRTGDLALSIVLGASRARVLGQLLLDAALLALAGGALGILVAHGFVRWFSAALGAQKPLWMSFEVDGPILLFALCVALGAALIAGLTPALRSARVSVREILQDESRGASSRRLGRLSHAMVVATMALAYPLLVAAGLLVASFSAWRGQLPFEGDDLLVAQLSLPDRELGDADGRVTFLDELIAWTEGQAGIRAATWGNVVPGLGAGTDPVEIEGVSYLREADRPEARLAVVRPGYFETVGVTADAGRTFDTRDRTGPPVAIVNAPFAARHLAGRDAVGRRLRVPGSGEEWRTIVGVVPDLRMNGTDRATPEGVYLPTPPIDTRFGHLLLRTASLPATAGPLVRRGVARLDPDLPIQRLETLDQRVNRTYWVINVVGPIFTTFGIAALFMASVGLFGVVAHSVSRRTREIGVRMALGATGQSVLLTIARSGLVQAVLGVGLGSGLAVAGSHLLAGALFGVRPGDPLTMTVVGAVLVVAALLATVLPALRAVRLSPVEALRRP